MSSNFLHFISKLFSRIFIVEKGSEFFVFLLTLYWPLLWALKMYHFACKFFLLFKVFIIYCFTWLEMDFELHITLTPIVLWFNQGEKQLNAVSLWYIKKHYSCFSLGSLHITNPEKWLWNDFYPAGTIVSTVEHLW